MSPQDAIFLAESAAEGRILAIYHSHPDGRAAWSAADDRGARFGAAPLYPEIPRVIVGCKAGVPFEIACYEFRVGGLNAATRGESPDAFVTPSSEWHEAWRLAINVA